MEPQFDSMKHRSSDEPYLWTLVWYYEGSCTWYLKSLSMEIWRITTDYRWVNGLCCCSIVWLKKDAIRRMNYFSMSWVTKANHGPLINRKPVSLSPRLKTRAFKQFPYLDSFLIRIFFSINKGLKTYFWGYLLLFLFF